MGFDRVKWAAKWIPEIPDLIEEAILLEEPNRKSKFEAFIQKVEDPSTKKRLELMLSRISILGNHVDGFLPWEITDFQNRIVRGLYPVLDEKYFVEYLREQKRNVTGLNSEIKRDMDTVPDHYGGQRMYAQLLPYYQFNSRIVEWLEQIIPSFSSVSQLIEVYPVISSEFVQPLFEELKDFFTPDQQEELLLILKTGKNASQKLFFRDNGNRLLDTFKKLKNADIVIGSAKKRLNEWVVENFQFLKSNIATDFTKGTVEKAISGDLYHCKNPIIEVRNRQILRATQLKKK